MKPGYKTTEFWLSAVAALVGLLIASGVIPSGGVGEKIVGLIASVLATLGYSVARGIAKS
jgi:hypothetical protein